MAMGFTLLCVVVFVLGLLCVFGWVVRALKQGRGLLENGDSHTSPHA